MHMFREVQKPRLGFLGLGWIGLQRMAAIGSSGKAEIVALADPIEDLVAKATEFAPNAARMRQGAASKAVQSSSPIRWSGKGPIYTVAIFAQEWTKIWLTELKETL
jgi:hypothetical protein